MTLFLVRRLGATVAACLCLGASVQAQPAGGAPGGGGPVEAAYVVTEIEPAPFIVRLPGRVVASQSVEIRPRAEGVISEIAFKEGRKVAAGEVLYRIEPDTYDAAVAEAEADLANAKASLPAAEANVKRYERIVGEVAAEVDLETKRTELAQAKAQIAAAEAALKSAKIKQALTVIKSPIDGVIGESAVSLGAVVTASQTDALATVQTLDPIYVDLSETSNRLLRVQAMMKSGELKHDRKTAPALRLTLENGAEYEEAGSFVTPYATVSETTGSFTIRTTFPNPDRILLPGMFVTATIEIGALDAVLVPQRAATRDASGDLVVYLIGEDGKIEKRSVKTSRAYRDAWVVTEGLEAGEKLVVDGFQKIQDGAQVVGLPAKVENGVVTLLESDSRSGAAPAAGGSTD